ncbi:MAG: hypothetical protein CSA38_04110 [Flavobacteriales bacterium]|nr:MAG: hypothetical protein CSA38_04110 [Flavobacteriales bacterium]
MKTIYKVFLGIFILFTAINFYAIDWNLGFLHDENTKYVFSICAGIIGLIFVFVMNTWSKLGIKK